MQHDLGGATFGGRCRLGMEDVGGLERTVGPEPTAQRAAGHQSIDLGRRPRGDGGRFIGRASAGPLATAPVSTGAEPAGSCGRLAEEQAPAPIASRTAKTMADGRHISQAPRWAGHEPMARPQPKIVHKTLESSIIRQRCHNNARGGKAIAAISS